jgi:uracil-DNA glycosylase family 4
MRWTERQAAMLREMGIRLWLPTETAAPPPASDAVGQSTTPGSTTPDLRREPERTERAGAVAADRPREAALADNRPGDIASLGWQPLAERAALCTACALCAGRTHSVFGAGPVHADWMVVGDAPGEEDDASGTPFSGTAGQLLANMLDAAGLTQGDAASSSQVYVTHSVKCKPPGGRAPESGEAGRCAPFLRRQIELVRPRIVLAMGRVAGQALVGGTEAFGKLRGRVHRAHGVPVVVTFDPAHLLRHAEDKAGAWDDLCLALEAAKLPAG